MFMVHSNGVDYSRDGEKIESGESICFIKANYFPQVGLFRQLGIERVFTRSIPSCRWFLFTEKEESLIIFSNFGIYSN